MKKVHSDTACVAIDIRVARLEGALRTCLGELTNMDASLSERQEAAKVGYAVLPDTGDGKQSWQRGAAGRRWLPLEVREQDIEAAICFAAHSKSTHENWAEWLGDGGDAPPEAGGLEHHQEYIQEYEHIITVLRAALDALEVE